MIVGGMLFPASFDRDEFSRAEEETMEFDQWQQELEDDEQFLWEQQHQWLLELPEAYGIDWQETA